jgi:hypothetical protein
MNTQLKFEVYEAELLNPLRGHELTELEKFVATLLLTATTHRPIGIKEVIVSIRSELNLQISERVVKQTVRKLRKEHGFPILARRKSPTGYWWCGSVEEMEAFIESFRAQALDELHTLSTIIKQNYPALQGQLKFDE